MNIEEMTARDLALANLSLCEIDGKGMAAIVRKIERADIVDLRWLLRWAVVQLREIKRLQYQRAN
jgi:hypothetical protein